VQSLPRIQRLQIQAASSRERTARRREHAPRGTTPGRASDEIGAFIVGSFSLFVLF